MEFGNEGGRRQIELILRQAQDDGLRSVEDRVDFRAPSPAFMLGCRHMPSARKEALRFLVPLYIICVLCICGYIFWPWTRPGMATLFVLALLLINFVAYFFRDPERAVP